MPTLSTQLRGIETTVASARARSTTTALSPLPDVLGLFARLTEDGSRPGCLLLESMATGAPGGRRSLLLPEPLLRVQLHGPRLTLTPLDDRGRRLLPLLADHLDATLIDDSATTTLRLTDADPTQPDHERLVGASPLDALRSLVTALDDDGPTLLPVLLGGSFGHDLVDLLDGRSERAGDADPELSLVLAVDGLLVDHERDEVTTVVRTLEGPGIDALAERRSADTRLVRYLQALDATAPATPGPEPTSQPGLLPFTSDLSDDAFLDGVRSLQRSIAEGEVFQAVLSRRLTTESDASPLRVYHHLRRRNPSPHGFFFDLGDGVLLGASPETCVSVRDGKVTITPIAGTTRRGRGSDGAIDAEVDARRAVSLLLDEKEQAEHVMLVDLARNDVARCCVPGTRRVEAPLSLASYSQVHHVTTRVTGTLRPELDALDAYRACANMGTVTGAPKRRAVELLRPLEASVRATYAGGLGYLGVDGTLDTCLVIRALRQRRRTSEQPARYESRAGAGVVADSRPEAELQETLDKARAPLLALAEADAELRR
ncbi:MAG: chorismate-binding protein [Acidobacteriota bacterium]